MTKSESPDLAGSFTWDCPACGREMESADPPDGAPCFVCAEEKLLATVGRLASEALRVADDLDGAVQLARASGATWQQIADELGVSRQAAQQRYGSSRPGLLG